MALFRPLAATTVTAGAAAVAYGSLIERNRFVTRHVRVPVLPPGAEPLKVLHLSDAHLTPSQQRKQQWMRSLAEWQPDLIVNTGDNIAHRDVLPILLDCYRDLLDVPGVFVFGSNDYYSPGIRNPLSYLWTDSGGEPDRVQDLPFEEMRAAFTSRGWLDLNNATGRLDLRGLAIAFSGVDDPHLDFDDLAAIEDPAPADADLRLGVAHAPYLRVLDRFNESGYDMIFAGHTHGGQLCVPRYGALVTNCDLDRARVSGLHQHRVAGHQPSWLHVSAGFGTSPYAPVRFCCRPEATLATLVARDAVG